MLDDLEPAIRLFRQSLERANQRKNSPEAMRFGVLLANAYIDISEFEEADACSSRPSRRRGTLGTRVPRPDLLVALAPARDAGRAAPAARYARKALELLELTEHTAYAARAHQLLAHVELDRGNAEEALELLDRGLPLVEQGGNRVEHALFQLEKARALVRLGRSEEAERLAGKRRHLEDASPDDAGRGHTVIAEVYESSATRSAQSRPMSARPSCSP